VRPFDQVAPLRDRVGELETVVLRVANIAAKADKSHCEKAAARVTMIQDELHRHLRPIPIDEPSQHAQADALGGQAIESLKQEIGGVREECEIDSSQEGQAVQEKSREERLAEALAELDGLIGLDTIKLEVRTLINFLKIQEERKRAGLPATALSLHMVFHGNPGTGKTSVARIVGKVYGALGVLKKGHLVETDRAGLVAEYAGQTGPKTNKKIDEALDGVLFIDEAYSLIAKEGDDPFGHEAVQTLLKRMEDDRERLVVILAGYPQEMNALLASNPGLSSRFGRQLTFEDYAPTELGRIFGKLCATNHYELPALARVKLLLGLDWLYDRRDRHFGNGRTVRNLFEQAIRRLANRVASIAEITREHLTVFDVGDIDFAGSQANGVPPANLFERLADDQRPFRIACPGCNEQTQMPQSFLLRRVKCRCGERFMVEWAEPAD
jgi:SpoVK/Ycf46/Vps4 family AAA+-type ATPase